MVIRRIKFYCNHYYLYPISVQLWYTDYLFQVHASPQRYHAAYIGACAVASMDVFEMSCVSAEEWTKMGVKACRKWGTS